MPIPSVSIDCLQDHSPHYLRPLREVYVTHFLYRADSLACTYATDSMRRSSAHCERLIRDGVRLYSLGGEVQPVIAFDWRRKVLKVVVPGVDDDNGGTSDVE